MRLRTQSRNSGLAKNGAVSGVSIKVGAIETTSHPFRRQFDRHRLGQSLDRVLGHHIDRAVALGADMAHLRGHVDDDPAAVAHHVPGRRLRDDERRFDVERDQMVERRLVDIEKRLRPVDAGIVDQDVEARQRRDRPAHRRIVGHVERQRARLSAATGDFRRHLLQFARGAAVQQQFGAGIGQRQCHGPPDAASRAGHQRELAVEPERVSAPAAIAHRPLLRRRCGRGTRRNRSGRSRRAGIGRGRSPRRRFRERCGSRHCAM